MILNIIYAILKTLIYVIASYRRAQLTGSIPIHTSTPSKKPQSAPSQPSVQPQIQDPIEEAQDTIETDLETDEQTGPFEVPDAEMPETDKVGGGDINEEMTDHSVVMPDPLEYRRMADPPARPETEGKVIFLCSLIQYGKITLGDDICVPANTPLYRP